jgi:hypothetical protein
MFLPIQEYQLMDEVIFLYYLFWKINTKINRKYAILALTTGSSLIRSRGRDIGSGGRGIGSWGRGVGGLGSIGSRGIRLLSGVHWGALKGHISDKAALVGGSVAGGLEAAIRESNGVGPSNVAWNINIYSCQEN